MMKSRRFAALTLALLATPAASCKTDPPGQMILAIQTDMSLPKDVSRIRIVVSYEDTGGVLFAQNYDNIGNPANPKSIRLPATLSLIAPEKKGRAVRIRVLATRGTLDDSGVRVVRDIVTTVPETRVALLPVPIEFLCDGTGKPKRDDKGKIVRDDDGDVVVESTCGDGFTCKAGKCVTEEVPSAELPDYNEAEVYGGGTMAVYGSCFDTAKCFEDAKDLDVDLDAFKADPEVCRTKPMPGGALNVGLKTQGSGMCNTSGCFVALDANSDGGFRAQADGSMVLPPAVCDRLARQEIAGVVGVPVGQAPCAQKRFSLPACDLVALGGAGLDKPMIVVAGQVSPVALAVDEESVYWTNQGSYEPDGGAHKKNGTVKRAPKAGGEPTVIGLAAGVPQGIALDRARRFVLWTDATGGSTGHIGWAPLDDLVEPSTAVLVDKLIEPSGIAVYKPDVYFTQLGAMEVTKVATLVDTSGTALVKESVNPVEKSKLSGLPAPGSVAAAADAVCWTHVELGKTDGVVACYANGALYEVATGQATPRALALSMSAAGALQAVVWANFAKDGAIWRSAFNGGAFEAPGKVVDAGFVASVAIDPEGGAIYYTSRDNGTVARWGTEETVLASGRKKPGAVAVDGDLVYWIEEGAGDAENQGTIWRMPKPKPE